MVKDGRLERTSKNDYNPDTDYNGARGIAMAEFELRKKGYPPSIPKPIKKIITLTPKVIGASPDVDGLVNRYLEELKNEGYSIRDGFKKMDKTERWNYFISVLKENDYFNS